LTYQVAGQHARIIVEDTGMGIGPELQGQLFQPFQRLGRENTAILGTGIGLSLCREFATLMGGRMGVSSHPGIGSSFWIELPLALDPLPPENSKVGPAPLHASSNTPRPRVILVEDDPASQFLVKKALEDMVQIEIIADGRDALARILDEPPELLLLDFNLPGLNGEEILQEIRSDVRTRLLKVIVISGVVGQERLFDMDCQGFLAKPLDSSTLRQLVGALVIN
jgi:CheY-like chemotaxis protein